MQANVGTRPVRRGAARNPAGATVAATVADRVDRDFAVWASGHFDAIKRLLDRDAAGWRD